MSADPASLDAAAQAEPEFGTIDLTRWIWNNAGSHRAALLRGFCWRVLEAIMAAVPIGVLILVLDQIQQAPPTNDQLVWWTSLIALSVVLRWGASYLANSIIWTSSYLFMGDLRIRILEHIRSLPLGLLSRFPTGDLITMTTQDIKMLELMPAQVIPSLITAIVVPVVVTGFALFVDWRLALIMLVTIPLSLIINTVIQRRMRIKAKIRQDIQGDAVSRIVEYVQGIQVIRAYGQRGSTLRQYEEAMERFRQTDTDLVRSLSALMGIFSTVLELGVALILFSGAWLLFGGEITATTYLIFLVISIRVYAPLQDINTSGEMARIAEASLGRVNRLLQVPAPVSAGHDVDPVRFDVTFDHVTFSYQPDQAGPPVLRDVSFTAPARGLTALVGPSGSGKSTIANLIPRLWDVDAGAVRIDGIDVRELPVATLNDSVSMVFQDVYLFNDTIRENIRFGRPGASREEVTAAAKSARCHDFISALPDGYDTMVGEGGATLSGGERQRISIARAMLKDAPIVLLDEATASVDSINETMIQEAINALVADKTLIVIAHRLSTIRAADRILVLDQGQIVEQGTHDHLLMEDGLYARFWRDRMKARSWTIGNTAAAVT